MRLDGRDGGGLMQIITRCSPAGVRGARKCGAAIERPGLRGSSIEHTRDASSTSAVQAPGWVRHCSTLLLGLLVLVLAASGCMHGDDRGMSLDPDEFIATAQLPDDLRLELAAEEPAVVDPVAVAFDAGGRMFVVEMGGYPTRPEGSPPLGRVKRLVDEDLDGYYETWTLFADGLPYPTSVLPWRDGVLVTAPPDILHLRDPDGDGVADTRDVLFTGFPVENTQHNINGLIWGVDNWVYGANGGNHGSGHPAGRPEAAVSIRGTDFRFRPDTRALEPSFETTGGHGIAFDAWGRMFGTHNVNHIQHMVFPIRRLRENPWLVLPTTRDMISDHGSSAQLFQVSDAQTRVNNPDQSGHFSGGAGIGYYGGAALPAAYQGSLFVNDVVVNVVHQDVLTPDGPSFTASRRDEGTELLAGRDNWFRPVSVVTGPEGALYVVDMHREVIEHPEWIPDAVEETLDLRAGDDKGRLSRTVPREGLPMVRPVLAGADLPALVDGLAHPGKWWRETAQRLLVERGDAGAVEPLRRVLDEGDDPLARLHALWTLRELDALRVGDLSRAVQLGPAGLRESAAVLAGDYLDDPDAVELVTELVGDQDARVRMQAVLTLAGTSTGRVLEALQRVLREDAHHDWTRYAVLAAIEDGHTEVIEGLLAAGGGRRGPDRMAGLLDAVRHLASMAVAAGGADDLSRLADLAGRPTVDDEPLAALLDGLADGLERHDEPSNAAGRVSRAVSRLLDSSHAQVVHAALRVVSAVGATDLPAVDRVVDRARDRSLDESLAVETRAAEVALLGLGSYAQVGETLLALMEPQASPRLQVEAARALAGLDGPARGFVALDRWRRYAPAVKEIVLDMLLRNQPFHVLLIEALENGDLRAGELDLDFGQRRRLLRRSSEDIHARAAAFFTDEEFGNRQAVVDEWLPQVVGRRGSAERGEAHFRTLCAQCHRFRGAGHPVGPSLDMSFFRGEEDLLTSILDPSAAFAPEYANYLVETVDGELLNGILAAENDAAVTLARANGETDTVPRRRIREFRAEGLSLMPDGLEQGLDADGLADLLAYLRQHDH
ncbi:MAG: c-type cytochrome [Acidobacteria bacterium]|nr:c-type cytochrome [Acidobacteriota bacterium]